MYSISYKLYTARASAGACTHYTPPTDSRISAILASAWQPGRQFPISKHSAIILRLRVPLRGTCHLQSGHIHICVCISQHVLRSRVSHVHASMLCKSCMHVPHTRHATVCACTTACERVCVCVCVVCLQQLNYAIILRTHTGDTRPPRGLVLKWCAVAVACWCHVCANWSCMPLRRARVRVAKALNGKSTSPWLCEICATGCVEQCVAP